MTDFRFWPAGTEGFLLSPHKSDRRRGYKARAKLLHDCPADQRAISVRLLEDFYCMETGDVVKTTRLYFQPELE